MSEKWNSKVMFPTDNVFNTRIIEASFGPSKSTDNLMVTVNIEIVSPQTYEIGRVEYNIAGVKAVKYFSLENKKDSSKNDKLRAQFAEFYTRCGLDASTIDYENVNVKDLLQKVLMTSLKGKSEVARKTPTLAQVQKGELGSVMKNPVTGKEEIYWKPEVTEFYGIAPEGSY